MFTTSKEIFLQMLEWIYVNTESHNQTEVARKIGLNPISMYKIHSGKTKRVKLETARAVNAAYGNPFNPEWIRGESDLMLVADLASGSPTLPASAASAEAPEGLDPITAALLASKDEIIAALRARLSDKDKMMAAKDEVIAAKDTLIAALRQQVIDLRTRDALERGVLIGGGLPDPTDKQAQIHPNPQPATSTQREGHT